MREELISDRAGGGIEARLDREIAARLEAVAALAEAKQRTIEVARLADFNRDLARCRDLNALLTTACRSARELAGADGATFVLREGDTVHYAAEDAVGRLWAGQRFPITRCISGWSILQGASAVVPDIYADPRIPVEAYQPTFVRSLVMAPVRAGAALGGSAPGEPIAAMGVYWATRHRATARELQLIEALADAAGIVLVNVRLYEEARQARLAAEEASRAKDVFLATLSHSFSLDVPAAPVLPAPVEVP